MAEQVISPDLSFVKEIINNGGESLKKCFQCATCSVVCNVTPDNKPFPRKEMVLAQWGQKDKLLSNPDVWLCHQCSDCTAYCPRGAKPGEVLGAIRKMTIKTYSSPSALANMVADSKYLILLFALPVLIFLGIIGARGYLSGLPEGEIVYAKLIPVPLIDTVFIAAAVFAVLSFIAGIRKYWAAMSNGVTLRGNLTAHIKDTIIEILTHKRFKKCNVTQARSTSHLLVFYAFVGLAITTTWAIAYLYGYEILGIQASSLFHFGESPYPLYDPMKILGNASALALLIGMSLVISNRLKNAEKAGAGSYFDWLFIVVVTAIMATGILSELLRLADIAALAYPIYVTHLVFIFFLFAYAPFSKMAHMFYRATAMVFAKQAARE
ncbi:MAG TPA: quinone-interacting membrane-bound oxidoreductase complex subunit QmoC [Thermodesulfovibrionales bacterium]|jgi:quinone-modifying oxidoreductase subunit QmoC|nr:quinone-interacting membrane-bound oxidoreductase complex subunit QmoC [Thermodesulfovibrionales bacterium]